jgi:hypothetical protein
VKVAFLNYMCISNANFKQLVSDLVRDLGDDMELNEDNLDEYTHLVGEECARLSQTDSPTANDSFSTRRNRINRLGVLAEVLHSRGEADQFIHLEECAAAAASDEDGFTAIYPSNAQPTEERKKDQIFDNEDDFHANIEVESEDELLVECFYDPSE